MPPRARTTRLHATFPRARVRRIKTRIRAFTLYRFVSPRARLRSFIRNDQPRAKMELRPAPLAMLSHRGPRRPSSSANIASGAGGPTRSSFLHGGVRDRGTGHPPRGRLTRRVSGVPLVVRNGCAFRSLRGVSFVARVVTRSRRCVCCARCGRCAHCVRCVRFAWLVSLVSLARLAATASQVCRLLRVMSLA